MIDNRQNWKQKIIFQLQHYKKKPYYYKVTELITNLFETQYDDIVSLNKDAINYVCKYLRLTREIVVFSSMNLQIKTPKAPDDWALNICNASPEVDEYYNPEGGLIFFNQQKFESNKIKIKFMRQHLKEYKQIREVFEK